MSELKSPHPSRYGIVRSIERVMKRVSGNGICLEYDYIVVKDIPNRVARTEHIIRRACKVSRNDELIEKLYREAERIMMILK
jgi:hypothetical protein